MSFKDDKLSLKKKNYNNSSYHREYNVVRCDHGFKGYNATDIAYQKSRQGQLNLENNQKKLKESLQITKDRYIKAIEKMNDEKVKQIY